MLTEGLGFGWWMREGKEGAVASLVSDSQAMLAACRFRVLGAGLWDHIIQGLLASFCTLAHYFVKTKRTDSGRGFYCLMLKQNRFQKLKNVSFQKFKYSKYRQMKTLCTLLLR